MTNKIIVVTEPTKGQGESEDYDTILSSSILDWFPSSTLSRSYLR